MSADAQKRSPISGTERGLLVNLHEATSALLEADDFARAYLARLSVADALRDLDEWIRKSDRPSEYVPPPARVTLR